MKIKGFLINGWQSFEDYVPENSENFSFWITLSIGADDSTGGELFRIHVCSLEWLETTFLPRAKVTFARHLLIVERFDRVAISEKVMGYINSCANDSYSKFAEELSLVAEWEFEDYEEEKTIPIGEKAKIVDIRVPISPKIETNFGFWITLAVKSLTDQRTDTYNVFLCTPEWLREEISFCHAGTPVWGAFLMIVTTFDKDLIIKKLFQYFSQYSQQDYELIMEKLERIGICVTKNCSNQAILVECQKFVSSMN